MSDSSTKTTKEQNLARIRDNQRRSRARRKEYIQELEAKIRTHEQLGVGASTEIQGAARKVLEENKRLRAMLRTRGVPEAEIAAALADNTYEPQPAAPMLTTMLDRRWAPNVVSTNDAHFDAQSDSTSLVSPTTTAEFTPLSIPQQGIYSRDSTEPYSPGSMISGTEPVPSLAGHPFLPMEATAFPEIKTEGMLEYNYQFDESSSSPWIYSADPNYAVNSVPYSNSTSCVDAANIIRTMQSDVGPELELDLGCHSLSRDCHVANSTVFNAIEKYSNQPIRM